MTTLHNYIRDALRAAIELPLAVCVAVVMAPVMLMAWIWEGEDGGD